MVRLASPLRFAATGASEQQQRTTDAGSCHLMVTTRLPREFHTKSKICYTDMHGFECRHQHDSRLMPIGRVSMIPRSSFKTFFRNGKRRLTKFCSGSALVLVLLHPSCRANFNDDGVPSGPIFSSPTPDISIPYACYTPGTIITITKHNPSSNPGLDWIYVPDDGDWWDFMPDSEYRYKAPEKSGSYELRFYWDDAEDNNWKSRLTFHVSDVCD